MDKTFSELILFQVKPDKIEAFESLIKSIEIELAKQPGVIQSKVMKRFYTFDGVELGYAPRELTKIVKCVKYFSVWEFESIDHCGKANGWFFENYEKAIQKLLIAPFDIHSGFMV